MAITALIAAAAPLDDNPDRLQALAPVDGQYLLERQVAGLAAAGVTTVRVAVAAMPGELVEVLERLVRRGVDIQPVRSAGELMASLVSGAAPDGTGDAATDDALMIVADGLVVQDAYYRLIGAADGAALLVTPDTPMTAHLERIDAGARWAGLARVPHSAVAALADLPGEWDMILTLLRFAVQGGAARFPCDAALFGRGDMAVVSDGQTADRLSQRRLQRGAMSTGGLGRSLVLLPLVRLAGPWLVRGTDLARRLPWAASAAWLVVGAATLLGWAWLALTGGLAALMMMAVTGWLFSFRSMVPDQRLALRLPGALAGALVALMPWLTAWQIAGIDALPAPGDAAMAIAVTMMAGLADRMDRLAGARHRAGWLLPDFDQIWLMLLPALMLGATTPVLGLILLVGLGQLLLWVRLVARMDPADAD